MDNAARETFKIAAQGAGVVALVVLTSSVGAFFLIWLAQ